MLIEALLAKRKEIKKEMEQASVEDLKQALEQQAEEEKKYQEFVNQMRTRAAEKEKARLKEVAEYRDALQQGRQQIETQRVSHNLQLMQDRITRQVEAEKKADLEHAKTAEERQRIEVEAEKKKQELITRIEKQEISARNAAEYDAAKTRAEKAQIAAKTIQELREVDFKHKLETEQKIAQIEAEAHNKSIQEARQKFQTEVDLVKQTLMEEKRLREGGPSTSAFKQVAGSFSNKQVFEELVQNRLQAGARSGRHGEGRKLTPSEVRRQVIREMQRGQIGQKEVQAAQLDLVQQTAVQGFKTGKLGKTTARALHEAARNAAQMNEQIDQQEQQIAEIEKFLKAQTDNSRRRAQRRGMRG